MGGGCVGDFAALGGEKRSSIASIRGGGVVYRLVDIATEYTVEYAVFSCRTNVRDYKTSSVEKAIN